MREALSEGSPSLITYEIRRTSSHRDHAVRIGLSSIINTVVPWQCPLSPRVPEAEPEGGKRQVKGARRGIVYYVHRRLGAKSRPSLGAYCKLQQSRDDRPDAECRWGVTQDTGLPKQAGSKEWEMATRRMGRMIEEIQTRKNRSGLFVIDLADEI